MPCDSDIWGYPSDGTPPEKKLGELGGRYNLLSMKVIKVIDGHFVATCCPCYCAVVLVEYQDAPERNRDIPKRACTVFWVQSSVKMGLS